MTASTHVNGSDREERLLKGPTGHIAISLAVGLFSVNLARQVIPALVPEIIRNLSLSPSTVGFALTLLWVCFASIQYPAGRISDKTSRTTVIVSALSIALTGALCFAFATNYWILLGGASLLGVGAGAYLISMRSYLGDLYTSRRGQAIGINQAVGNIGSTSAGFLAIVILAVSVWQASFLIIAPLLLLSVILVHVTSTENYHIESISIELKDALIRILASKQLRYFVISYALVNFTFKGILSFLPTFLQVTKSFTPAEANLTYALFFVLGILIVPTAGTLSDRFPGLQVVMVSLLFAICGLITLIISHDKILAVVGVVVFAGGLSGFPVVMQSHLLGIFPASHTGGDFGAFRTIYLVFGSLGPMYVGIIADSFKYSTAFAGFILFLFVCFLLLFRINRHDLSTRNGPQTST